MAGLGGLDEGPAPLLLVGGSGPLIAALAVRNAEERRDLLQRTVRVDRLGKSWGPVIAVGVGPALAGALTATLLRDSASASLAGAGGALAFGLLAGIGEEPGWRGTLLGPLIERHGHVSASLRVGLIWSIWHLPLYFAPGTYLHRRGLAWFVVSLLEIPALSVLLTWIYRRSRWLVAAPLLAHALGNAAIRILPGGTPSADIAQSVAIVAAGALVAHHLRQVKDKGNDDNVESP